MMLANDHESLPAELGLELGAGASGVVYEVRGMSDKVAKIYVDAGRAPSRAIAAKRRARIEAMLCCAPRLQTHEERGVVFHQLAWPTHHVLDIHGDALGFAMPRLPLAQACDLEAVLTPRGRRIEGVSDDYVLRVFIARNVAALVRELHRLQHYIIDLKPKNLAIYRTNPPGLVAVLDADGFSISGPGGGRFPAEYFSSEYYAPELLAAAAKPSAAGELQDRWALAVIIFRLLNEGIHPYSGVFVGGSSATIDDHVRNGRYAYGAASRPDLKPLPLSIHQFFDNDTRQLFDRAFQPDPYLRPSAKDWRDHLTIYCELTSKKLAKCRVRSDHWHFSAGCGLCWREAAMLGGTVKAAPKQAQAIVPPGALSRQTAGQTISSRLAAEIAAVVAVLVFVWIWAASSRSSPTVPVQPVITSTPSKPATVRNSSTYLPPSTTPAPPSYLTSVPQPTTAVEQKAGPESSHRSVDAQKATMDQETVISPSSEAPTKVADPQRELMATQLSIGSRCFDAKDFDCAVRYAEQVLQIDGANEEAQGLKERSRAEQNRALRKVRID